MRTGLLGPTLCLPTSATDTMGKTLPTLRLYRLPWLEAKDTIVDSLAVKSMVEAALPTPPGHASSVMPSKNVVPKDSSSERGLEITVLGIYGIPGVGGFIMALSFKNSTIFLYAIR